MDKFWTSTCLLVHKEFNNPCFISMLKLVWKLQTLVYVVVKKEFTTINLPFLLDHIDILWYILVDAQNHGS